MCMKKLISLLIAILIMLSLCACGEKSAAPAATTPATDSDAQTPATPTDEKVSVWIITGSEGTTGGLTAEYDENHNLQKVVGTSEWNGQKETLEYTFEFNKAGKPNWYAVSFSGREPNYERFSYDMYGNEVSQGSQYTYDAEGRILTETRSDGAEHTYTYNADGKLTNIQRYEEERFYQKSYAYDDAGNLIAETGYDGYLTTYEYDAQGREIACNRNDYAYTVQYNENGSIEKIIVNKDYPLDITSKQIFVSPERAEAIREQQKLLFELVIAG